MKKILVLQFRKSPQYVLDEQGVFKRAFKDVPATVAFKNAALRHLNWGEVDEILEGATGVILGGSGELDFDGGRGEADAVVQESAELSKKTEPFLSGLELRGVPVLGICYGHQLLGHVRGVAVVNDEAQAKAGTHPVTLTEAGKTDPLFADIPVQFCAQYGHKDTLSELPPGATLLAYGEQCAFAAVRLTDKHYSLQFHPELTAEDMLARFNRHPEFLPPGKTPEMLITDSRYASHILANFVTNIV